MWKAQKLCWTFRFYFCLSRCSSSKLFSVSPFIQNKNIPLMVAYMAQPDSVSPNLPTSHFSLYFPCLVIMTFSLFPLWHLSNLRTSALAIPLSRHVLPSALRMAGLVQASSLWRTFSDHPTCEVALSPILLITSPLNYLHSSYQSLKDLACFLVYRLSPNH